MEEGQGLLLSSNNEDLRQPKRPKLLDEEEEEQRRMLFRKLAPEKAEWIRSLDYPCNDDDMSRFVSFGKNLSYFEVAGSVDCWGYAAILRDYSETPLIASCGVLSESEKQQCASAFYTELKGVSAAVKLAVKYGVGNFEITAATDYVANFVRGTCRHRNFDLELGTAFNAFAADGSDGCLCWMTNYPCIEHVWMQLKDEDKKDIKVIYILTVDMVSDLLQLMQKLQGLLCFYIGHGIRAERIRAAQYLAKLGKAQVMMPSDMFKCEGLIDILYEDACLW